MDAQLGLEATPDAYVAALVAVFREVRRVLADDGTLWLNLGDSYNAYNGGAGPSSSLSRGAQTEQRPQLATGYGLKYKGLKPKDLIGIPWRVAFALQADGWYLRSDIIWHKPNPMPESVTDRPTKAHEYLFLLSKRPTYFYDADAVRETTGSESDPAFYEANRKPHHDHAADLQRGMVQPKPVGFVSMTHPLGRNRRTVWTVATQPFSEAHFATFPPALIEPCILAGTSAKGQCPECSKPWLRQAEDTPEYAEFKRAETERRGGGMRSNDLESLGLTRGTSNKSVSRQSVTTGWAPSCAHGLEPVPDVVLDPFGGAGTTGLVADRLGRNAILIELNPDYVKMAERRVRADCSLFADVSVLARE